MKIIVTEGTLLEKAVWGWRGMQGVREGEGGVPKGPEEIRGDNGHVYYPDSDDGFTILFM